MFLTVISLLLYLTTTFVGLYIDSATFERRYDHSSVKTLKRLYLVWLYIFLCFGYMTGSDWRNYELTYIYGDRIDRLSMEPASSFVFTFFPKFISDFVLFMGIVKCIYLYSVYKLVSAVTSKWVSVLALLIPFKLGFMLIQNPFRFMLALIFINFAFRQIYLFCAKPSKHNTRTFLLAMGIGLISVLFHTSCVVFLVLIPLSCIVDKVKKVNPYILFFAYVVFAFFTSNLSYVNGLKESAILYVQRYMEMSDYSNYESDSNEVIWSIGNLLRFLFFYFIVRSRNQICQSYNNGSIVYGFTVFYFFLSRLLILIPTGFRLSLPFMVFYVVMIIYMISCGSITSSSSALSGQGRIQAYGIPKRNIRSLRYIRFCAQIIIVYSAFSFGKKAWTSYDIIPYTNSIPYIMFGHKSYDERSQYNLDAYMERLGEPYEKTE